MLTQQSGTDVIDLGAYQKYVSEYETRFKSEKEGITIERSKR
jgi:hypothetical protein